MRCPAIEHGKIVHGDSAELLKCLPDESVDLIVTSPPYATMRDGYYSGISQDKYASWFLPIAGEIKRVLSPKGSFVINIKENVSNGERHPYVMDVVKGMRSQGWKWIDTYVWYKQNPHPIKPARRLKDGYENIYHFAKNLDFTFNPENVREPSKRNMCDYYKKSIAKGKEGWGNTYSMYPDTFEKHLKSGSCDKAYPSNVLVMAVGQRKKAIHPASFPEKLPAFFIKLMSNPGDVVLDPFAGGGTTNVAAKKACRETIGFDLEKNFVTSANKELRNVACEAKVS